MIRSGRQRQVGFGGITVLVLVVLLALLGTYMSTVATLSSLDTMTSGGAIQSWFTARSGVQWAVFQALERSCTCGTNCCTTAPSIDGATINFVDGGTNGYSAVFSCTESSFQEGPDTYCVYNLGVTASRDSPADATFVSRTIRISVTDRSAP